MKVKSTLYKTQRNSNKYNIIFDRIKSHSVKCLRKNEITNLNLFTQNINYFVRGIRVLYRTIEAFSEAFKMCLAFGKTRKVNNDVITFCSPNGRTTLRNKTKFSRRFQNNSSNSTSNFDCCSLYNENNTLSLY